MYRKIKVFSLIASLMAFSLPAAAVDDLLESVAKGCEKELTTFCKDVTPGEGRILACLYAILTRYQAAVNMRFMMQQHSWNVR